MQNNELFIRKYDSETKAYQLTDDSIDFPVPNTLEEALKALTVIFQEKTQILKQDNKPATRMTQTIDSYIWNDETSKKNYLTVKVIKATQPEKKYSLVSAKMETQVNRASISQQESSKQACIEMKDKILAYFQQRIQNLSDLALGNFQFLQKGEEQNAIKIQQILKAAENQINKNKDQDQGSQIIKFKVNKYQKLEKSLKILREQKVKSYSNTTISKYINGFSQSVQIVISAIQNILNVLNRIFEKVPKQKKSFYDEKNIFEGKRQQNTAIRLAKYLFTILQLATSKDLDQKLKKYEQQEGIKNDMRIKSLDLLQMNKIELCEYNKLLPKLKTSKIQISNLFYFLQEGQQNNLIQTMRKSLNEQIKNLKENMEIQYLDLINFELCSLKKLCPCCNQICFQQGNHPQLKHRAAYHQVRGWGGTVVTLNNLIDNQSYLSTLVCEDLYEDDNMLINNEICTWSKFKNENSCHWQLPSRSDIEPQIKKEEIKLWNTYGENFAKQNNKRFRKSEENLIYHIIFIIDQSRSMKGQWSQVKSMFEKLTKKIKQSKKENNLNGNNCIVSTILFSDSARFLDKFVEINNIGSLPQRKPGKPGKGTYYMKAFKCMQQILPQSKQYSTTTFFLTDREAKDSKKVKEFIITLNEMKFVPIFFTHRKKTRLEGSKFEQIFKSVKGSMKHSDNIKGIEEIIQTEIESLIPK